MVMVGVSRSSSHSTHGRPRPRDLEAWPLLFFAPMQNFR
jgi:hypothetical protein